MHLLGQTAARRGQHEQLPEALKARVAAAAKRAGTAIAEKADQEERRADFNEVAEQRYARIVARLTGRKAKRPAARKLAR